MLSNLVLPRVPYSLTLDTAHDGAEKAALDCLVDRDDVAFKIGWLGEGAVASIAGGWAHGTSWTLCG